MSYRARKRFGQNFLVDTSVIEHIIRAIHVRPGDRLVEIGPGLGAMTCPLLKAAGELDVIELDRDVIPLLQQHCGHFGQLNIHNVDVLKYDFKQLITSEKKLRIVGNLPYNISTPILFHLLQYADSIQDMHFMLQKEVVKRMAAGPGGGDYGRLTVMLQYHCKVTALFEVPPTAFDPQPKVDSAIVRLEPIVQSNPVIDHGLFKQLVQQAFSQRRKTIKNTLKKLCTVEDLEQVGIDARLRPEEISLQAFIQLSNHLSTIKPTD